MRLNNSKKRKTILWLSEISSADLLLVGGKNASLGEMYNRLSSKGIRVPNAFIVSTTAFKKFLKDNQLENYIFSRLKKLDKKRVADLQMVGAEIRKKIMNSHFSLEFESEVFEAYKKLSKQYNSPNLPVAVRSSATAEDMPKASFAGQQESYLNVNNFNKLLLSIKSCMASLYTDRAISYRIDQGFKHEKVSISVTVQKMVRSDSASSGTMFTVDTESGFEDVVLINSSYGLGENLVKGKVVPDEFLVYKPLLGRVKRSVISKRLGSKRIKMVLDEKKYTKNISISKRERDKFSITDSQAEELASWAVIIENLYKRPMDIEWALDGKDERIYIVQARPETVHRDKKSLQQLEYRLEKKGRVIAKGDSIGGKIGAGKVQIVRDVKKIKNFPDDAVLVARVTDPDWEPLMKKASAIITESGGRTCHAAIVSRELGVPCIVGVKDALRKIKNGSSVTVDCSSGEVGLIYQGELPYRISKINLNISRRKVKPAVMLNVGDPDSAFKYADWPHQGVGLARLEFIIAGSIKIHPLVLINYKKLKSKTIRREIDSLTEGYADKKQYYIEKLAQGIAKIAVAFSPYEVIVRFSDFKSNEYANLIGGEEYEPREENPMIGWRGAVRYYDPIFKPAFELECQAIRVVREEMGLKNVKVMIPFCRTVDEAKNVLKILKKNKLVRGKNGLEVYMMVEIPSNVVLAKDFTKLFDGFSIGSNDLTQLTLGLDRDSGIVKHVGDERNEAVKKLITEVIKVANKARVKIGLCGQAPSDFPEYAEFLAKSGIDSLSVTPDKLFQTLKNLSKFNK